MARRSKIAVASQSRRSCNRCTWNARGVQAAAKDSVYDEIDGPLRRRRRGKKQRRRMRSSGAGAAAAAARKPITTDDLMAMLILHPQPAGKFAAGARCFSSLPHSGGIDPDARPPRSYTVDVRDRRSPLFAVIGRSRRDSESASV